MRQRKRQTKGSKDQIPPRLIAVRLAQEEAKRVAGRDNQSREDTIGMDTGHADGCGLNWMRRASDSQSAIVRTRVCRLTYAPETDRTYVLIGSQQLQNRLPFGSTPDEA